MHKSVGERVSETVPQTSLFEIGRVREMPRPDVVDAETSKDKAPARNAPDQARIENESYSVAIEKRMGFCDEMIVCRLC